MRDWLDLRLSRARRVVREADHGQDRVEMMSENGERMESPRTDHIF
jgi:hypothetical protein